ncbi:MAG: hypothetical protein KJP02_08275, partial [Octadecabacter sp.]|nr:hypothetical protein [Octadecabacter sp.]
SERMEALRATVERVADIIRTSADNIAEGWQNFRDSITAILDGIGERFDALVGRVQAFIDTIRNLRDSVSDAFTFEGDTPVDRRGRPTQDSGAGGASGMWDPASFTVPSPAGPTSDQAGGAPSVVNNTTANAQATFSIVVPPGSTAEQIAFIQAEIDRGLNRAAEQAARSLEA